MRAGGCCGNPHCLHTLLQALALKAHPSNASSSLLTFANMLDDMWYYAGDRSTDFNWYTKRGLLAAVYCSTGECGDWQTHTHTHTHTYTHTHTRTHIHTRAHIHTHTHTHTYTHTHIHTHCKTAGPTNLRVVHDSRHISWLSWHMAVLEKETWGCSIHHNY